MRALILNEGVLAAGPMGHGSVAAVLQAALPTAGVDARFIGLPPVSGVPRLATRGIPGLRSADLDAVVARWHLVQSLRARRLLESELQREAADVLHVNSHAIALLLAEHMTRTPTILSIDATVWNVRAMELRRALRRHSRIMVAPSLRLERRALQAARGIVVFSEWARRSVQEIAPTAHCVEIHPGVDIRQFRPVPQGERRRLRMLFVGGQFEQKGGLDLLAAAEPLLGTRVELDVVTQTDVPCVPNVRVHRLSAGDPRLVELYQQADMFCLPTWADAAPFAVLEAMACGTAIVSSSVSSIPQMLDGGRAGLLVPPHDPSALRGAIEQLEADPARRAALGRRAREVVEERYDSRRQAERLAALMREVVDRHA